MGDVAATATTRRLIAWIHMSIDGFTAGPDDDVAFLVEHAVHEPMAAYFEGVWRGASTVLLGRRNYEGFASAWPPLVDDPDAPARDREFAGWLDAVDKVVFSRTLPRADWRRARVASADLEGEALELKQAEGRDILVLNSTSIVRGLVDADLVDELHLNVLPAVVGSGLRLFPEGRPSSAWQLDGVTTFATGAVGLHYRRGNT